MSEWAGVVVEKKVNKYRARANFQLIFLPFFTPTTEELDLDVGRPEIMRGITNSGNRSDILRLSVWAVRRPTLRQTTTVGKVPPAETRRLQTWTTCVTRRTHKIDSIPTTIWLRPKQLLIVVFQPREPLLAKNDLFYSAVHGIFCCLSIKLSTWSLSDRLSLYCCCCERTFSGTKLAQQNSTLVSSNKSPALVFLLISYFFSFSHIA